MNTKTFLATDETRMKHGCRLVAAALLASFILHLSTFNLASQVTNFGTTSLTNKAVTVNTNGVLQGNPSTNLFRSNGFSAITLTLATNTTAAQWRTAISAAGATNMVFDSTHFHVVNGTNVALSNTAVTAGSYGTSWTNLAAFTVDAQGRLTGASNAASLGTNFHAAAGVIALSNTAVTAGSYGSASTVPVFTVDAQGRVIGVTATTIATGSTNGGTVTTITNTGGGVSLVNNSNAPNLILKSLTNGNGTIVLANNGTNISITSPVGPTNTGGGVSLINNSNGPLFVLKSLTNADGTITLTNGGSNIVISARGWNLGGNNASGGDFIGTTSDFDLKIRVRSDHIARFVSSAAGEPGVILGLEGNSITNSPGSLIVGGWGDDSSRLANSPSYIRYSSSALLLGSGSYLSNSHFSFSSGYSNHFNDSASSAAFGPYHNLTNQAGAPTGEKFAFGRMAQMPHQRAVVFNGSDTNFGTTTAFQFLINGYNVGIGTNNPGTNAVQAVGAVKADFFVGDGSQLTGLTAVGDGGIVTNGGTGIGNTLSNLTVRAGSGTNFILWPSNATASRIAIIGDDSTLTNGSIAPSAVATTNALRDFTNALFTAGNTGLVNSANITWPHTNTVMVAGAAGYTNLMDMRPGAAPFITLPVTTNFTVFPTNLPAVTNTVTSVNVRWLVTGGNWLVTIPPSMSNRWGGTYSNQFVLSNNTSVGFTVTAYGNPNSAALSNVVWSIGNTY